MTSQPTTYELHYKNTTLCYKSLFALATLKLSTPLHSNKKGRKRHNNYFPTFSQIRESLACFKN